LDCLQALGQGARDQFGLGSVLPVSGRGSFPGLALAERSDAVSSLVILAGLGSSAGKPLDCGLRPLPRGPLGPESQEDQGRKG